MLRPQPNDPNRRSPLRQDTSTKKTPADIEYDGKIYVAPVGRGVTLLDLEDRPTLDEAIEEAVAKRYGAVYGWTGLACIRVEIVDPLPDEDF